MPGSLEIMKSRYCSALRAKPRPRALPMPRESDTMPDFRDVQYTALQKGDGRAPCLDRVLLQKGELLQRTVPSAGRL